jgi:DAK2 domain fusion protein YloV
MILNISAVIEIQREELNNLNVFPVPDGDTGTNMCVTLMAGCKALKDSFPKTVGRTAEIAADALLRGASGNSGVILALLFRGMAKKLKDYEEADAQSFADALLEGVDSAYKSVANPVEGTILTVSRIAATEAVRIAENESDIEAVIRRAIGAGYIELEKTREINPVLKSAGVVDSGAKGFLYLLEGMLAALSGNCTKEYDAENEIITEGSYCRRKEKIAFAYCTEFFAEKKIKPDLSPFRVFLGAIGDSLIFVEDESVVKVHIHTNAPGAVLTEALTYLARLTAKIENMCEQHTRKFITSAE